MARDIGEDLLYESSGTGKKGFLNDVQKRKKKKKEKKKIPKTPVS